MRVIHPGIGPARIVSVTARRVAFVDDQGEGGTVDLDECARVWAAEDGVADAGEQRPRCVGWRGSLFSNPSWARFIDRQDTRFEFQTGAEMVQSLLAPLQEFGCVFNDAT